MMQLDARDLDILRVLSTDGRITKAALAARVGLSPTPCWERLKKLEKAEVIHQRSSLRNMEAVEWATLKWADWFNNRRLMEPIGNVPRQKQRRGTMQKVNS